VCPWAGLRSCRGDEERGGLQTYLRPVWEEFLGTLGHDGIRAQGSQSMETALAATLVVGCPCAGPTCSAVTRLAFAALGGNSFR